MGGENSTTTTGDYWKTTDNLAHLRDVRLLRRLSALAFAGLKGFDVVGVDAVVDFREQGNGELVCLSGGVFC